MAETKDKPKEGRRGPDPAIAAVLGWAIPGAGHVYAGKYGKAALFFAAISGAFLFGLAISGFKCVSYSQQPVWFLGQVFAGLPSVALAILDPAKAGVEVTEALDVGTLFTTIAGLLNLLVAMNAMNEARKAGSAQEKADAAEPKPAGKGKGGGA